MPKKRQTRRPSHPIHWMEAPSSRREEKDRLILPCNQISRTPTADQPPNRDSEGFYILTRKEVRV